MSNDYSFNIAIALQKIAKAIDRLTEVLKPVEITCENKLVVKEEESTNE